MATRDPPKPIGPRPVEWLSKLSIIKEVSQLDSPETVAVIEGTANKNPGDASSVEVEGFHLPLVGPQPAQKKKSKPKEIPVPEVKVVATYTREYLPLYNLPEAYIHGMGGVGWTMPPDVVEYDLDNDDEDWLEAYNRKATGSVVMGVPMGGGMGGLARFGAHASSHPVGSSHLSGSQSALLSDIKFERMLWKLDLACHDATERALNANLHGLTEKTSQALAQITGHLSKEEALAILRKAVGGREQTIVDVFHYWLSKRKRGQKPLLRRLQAPTPMSDNDPFHVFRPREKANRPQQRRRRENSHECLDKMRSMREDLLHALQVSELLVLREKKKRDIVKVDIGFQKFKLQSLHPVLRPRGKEEVEIEASSNLTSIMASTSELDAKIKVYGDSLQGLAQNVVGSPLSQSQQQSLEFVLRDNIFRKRKHQDLCENISAQMVDSKKLPSFKQLPTPPLTRPDQELLFVMRPNPTAALPPSFFPPVHEQIPASSNATSTGNASKAMAPPSPGPSPGLHPNLAAVKSSRSWRIARGGRLMFTRVDPYTMDPLCPEESLDKEPDQGQPSVGALSDQWFAPQGQDEGEEPLMAHFSKRRSQRESPWAASFPLSNLPWAMDWEDLVMSRSMVLKQHASEVSSLAVLSMDKLCDLGSGGGGATENYDKSLATLASRALTQLNADLGTKAQAIAEADRIRLGKQGNLLPAT